MTQPDLVLAMSDNAKYVVGDGIGFLFVVAILARYVVPLASKAMTARQEVITKQLADSAAAHERLAEAEHAYAKAVESAKAEAARLEEEARVQYAAIIAEATAAAEAKAEEVTVRAREAMEAERISAIRSLQAEITGLTVELAERKVLEALGDENVQHRVTDRFLTELESGRVSQASAGRS